MKKQFIRALTTITLAIAGPCVSSSLGQDFVDGPVGEISSVSSDGAVGADGADGAEGAVGAGDEFGGFDFSGAGVAPSQDVAYTSSGEAIEIFNPNVPVGGPAAQSQLGTKTDWITEDGRMNLQRQNPQNPETALWVPQGSPNRSGWTDGPMGLQVGVDWLLFTRGVNGGSDFAVNDSGETFSTADIKLDSESTVRYRLGIASEYGTGYEFVAYDFDQFSGDLALTGEGITTRFFAGVPSEPAQSYTATYQTRIKSYELNVWSRRSEGLRVGYGLRNFAIEDTYNITEGTEDNNANSGGVGGGVGGGGGNSESSGFFSTTDNNLFGGQIMLELYRRVTPSTYLEGGVRGMLFNNRADIDVRTATREISGEDSFVSGGVGFNGGLSYRPFGGLRFRAGYEGVFLGSVASGPAQSDNTTPEQFFGPLNPIGEGLYFGGGYVGCTVTF